MLEKLTNTIDTDIGRRQAPIPSTIATYPSSHCSSVNYIFDLFGRFCSASCLAYARIASGPAAVQAVITLIPSETSFTLVKVAGLVFKTEPIEAAYVAWTWGTHLSSKGNHSIDTRSCCVNLTTPRLARTANLD